MGLENTIQSQNTVVVTGAALGIGRSAVLYFASHGMNVCLLDVASADLEETRKLVEERHPKGASGVYSSVLDVSDEAAFGAVRDEILERFGSVSVLMNNAASRGGRGWEASHADWRVAFEVNFWGVINGVNAFLPAMLEDGKPGFVINVGSKQGITNPPGHPIYNVSKSALKTYTELLQHELRNKEGCQISAHLLVPGWTTTGKNDHKPGAWLPEQVINRMMDGLEKGGFYIVCPDEEVTEDMDRKRILWGAQDVTENRPPLSRWHRDWSEKATRACN